MVPDVDRIRELTESEPATPAPWQVACVRACYSRALAEGLRLPRLVFRWRRGPRGPGVHVQGATVHVADGGIFVYLRTDALDLPRTTFHELFHVHAITTGLSQRISLAEEEERADEFARQTAAINTRSA